MKAETKTKVSRRAVGFYGWVRDNTDLLMLAGLALLITTGWLVAELADEVVEGSTQKYDEWVLRRLRVPGDMTDPIGPDWFEDAWRDITALGSYVVLGLMTIACAGYLWMRKHRGVLVLLVVATVGGLVVSLGLKNLFSRPRPEFASGTSHVMTASFPSGHAMLSAVVYLTVAVLLARTTSHYRFRVYYLAVGLILTGLVGLSRIYLGVHYPTDVLAGWSFGLVWALLCWLTAHFLQKRGTIAPPQTGE